MATTRDPAIEERFARDWGIELPDSIFQYWAFQQACGPAERNALRDLDIQPYGIMDIFAAPERAPRDGIDVRVQGRYYRDPPEFFTFMHGGSDGLHFGLWYDNGRTCDGVASYYNNDGDGVGLPAGTPLEAVRRRLEWGQDSLDRDPDEMAYLAPGIELLRRHLMNFETADRPEQGQTYLTAHPPRATEREDRLETLDSGGALVQGRTLLPRAPQRRHDNFDFFQNTRKELTADPTVRAEHVTAALTRCTAGEPADALTLGRDLHWISAGEEDREHQANELLTAAYQALGRDTLTAVAKAHHRHRALPNVTILEGQ